MPNNQHTAIQDEGVILLHGLNRSSSSLQKLADVLENQGYMVWNESYPSREKPIAELAKIAIEPALAYCRKHGIKKNPFRHAFAGRHFGALLPTEPHD